MRSAEVCVVGAGPAGSAAAIRLARLGHRVLLVERGGPGRAPAAESLPPSALPWLEQLGLREAVEAAGFMRPRGSLVEWDGAARKVDGDGTAGFQVERARFDELLREASMAAGAGLHRPAAVRAIEHDGGAWLLRLADGETLEAQAIVDARGRRAGAALGPPTAALFAEWQGADACAGHGRVQALRDAWIWAAPLPDGRCSVAVFADAARIAALGGPGRADFYDRTIASAGLLAPVLGNARRGPLQVRDASARRHPAPADERGLMRVGESACALDPLSSQGVASALRQGVQAAACLHTALERPADAAWAWAFHRDQVMRASRRHEALAAGFYGAAAARFDEAFWTARASPADDAEPPPPPPPRPWPALDARLRLEPRARWQLEPVLDGNWVRPCQALVHPALDAPFAFWGGRPARDWLQPLDAAPALPALLERWCMLSGEALAGSLWQRLWRQGLIVSAG